MILAEITAEKLKRIKKVYSKANYSIVATRGRHRGTAVLAGGKRFGKTAAVPTPGCDYREGAG